MQRKSKVGIVKAVEKDVLSKQDLMAHLVQMGKASDSEGGWEEEEEEWDEEEEEEEEGEEEENS